MLQIKSFSFNAFQERTILMWDETHEGVVVDPGCCDDAEYQALADEISREGIVLKAVWLTHGHLDHVYGASRIAGEHGTPVLMNPLDREVLAYNDRMAQAFGMQAPGPMPGTIDINDGDILTFGNCSFKVLATPGHTPGSVTFHDEAEKLLISGDTLFAGSIGRTDLPGGNYDKLIVSLMDGIMGLDGDTDVIPGHGPVTNIGRERTHNPFLQPFNEREELFPDEDMIS